MKTTRLSALSTIGVSALLVSAIIAITNQHLSAYANGGPSGYTGAPGESNCTSCHGGFAINSGPATFAVSTSAPIFTPGAAHPVTVAFSNTTNVRHGFEITARNGSNAAAGTWQVVQNGMTHNSNGSTAHHTHTQSGTSQGSWTMNWVGPATLPAGPITFYADGADCNNNSSTSGDRIYHAVQKLYQASLTSSTTSWASGTSHQVNLNAPGHGGQIYLIGVDVAPGQLNLGGALVMEVNPFSGFTDFALQNPAIFSNLLSGLDTTGHGTATVNVPPIPGLTGFHLYFGAVTADLTYTPTEVSNRLDVVLQ